VGAETDRGEPPKVIDPTPGCRFRWRCPLAIDVCAQITPLLAELGPRHDVACHVAQAETAEAAGTGRTAELGETVPGERAAVPGERAAVPGKRAAVPGKRAVP
jgi:hypothetical protein